jgi:hypothetical protein
MQSARIESAVLGQWEFNPPFCPWRNRGQTVG